MRGFRGQGVKRQRIRRKEKSTYLRGDTARGQSSLGVEGKVALKDWLLRQERRFCGHGVKGKVSKGRRGAV